MTQKMALSLAITHLPEKKYLMKEYILNREHGSAFDCWLASGALPLTDFEAKTMDDTCEPQFFPEDILPENGTILYKPTLEPLEIRCATFRPI